MPRRTAAAKAEAAAKAREEEEQQITEKVHSAVDDVAAAQVSRVESQRRAKLHPLLQFPLVGALSLAVASVGYALLGLAGQNQLAAVTRTQDTWGEVGVLVGWRAAELAIGWFGNLDSWDVAMMDLLAHGPTLYLLMTFYSLDPYSAAASLLIDVASSAIPFYLLRPLSTIHTAAVNKLPNRELLDVGLQFWVTALATAIYSVIVTCSLRLILPSIFVLHFRGIPSVEQAYTASYTSIIPVTVLFGAAASTFIFAPYVLTAKDKEEPKFNPAEASFTGTLQWNLWGYNTKTKVVISRTATVIAVTVVNTYVSLTLNIYGVNGIGAAVYSSVWAVAALLTGIGIRFVSDE